MTQRLSRRGMLAASAIAPIVAHDALARPRLVRRRGDDGWVRGRMTGAEAVVETLLKEGADLVFGIPGAQENELWDTMKSRGLGYLLVTHEFSAACMADGYARATGRPGVLCVVPGPGVTNSLTGLGEALLDSIPVVAIVGDIARGADFRPFQVHALNQKMMLESVCKCVYEVKHVSGIPQAIRQAFASALAGEPGPTAVVIPYTLLMEPYGYESPPLAAPALPFDEPAAQKALALLANRRTQVGIYAGLGCMDHTESLVGVAELLQAPVATSVSGKGCIPETHLLAVGWGFGPQGTRAAEHVFKHVDCLLAIGAKFSEVSTGFYANPQPKHVIHVDANACNIGKVLRTDVGVHADAGVFLGWLLNQAHAIRRPTSARLNRLIEQGRADDAKHRCRSRAAGIEPMDLILALRKHLPEDGLFFVDVTCSEHHAAEAFRTCRPRTYFNPTDNQAMGWSIPAALGAQRACPGKPVITLTGDGCFLMSSMEISTAARENLPVKFFVLDDQTYHYMQLLQSAAYLRTTATILSRLDYAALAKGYGVAYCDIARPDQLDGGVANVLAHPGPVLARVCVDYRNVSIRWIDAVRDRFTKELSASQKARFLARMGSRALDSRPNND